MLVQLTFVIGGILLFVLATACFHFFPRTAAGAAIFALVLGKTDAGTFFGLPSVYVPGGNKDVVVILLTLVLFLWFVPGLVSDLMRIRGRWQWTRDRLKQFV